MPLVDESNHAMMYGYAYSYTSLEDPVEWALLAPDDRPCVIGRQRFRRISIANSDAAATPHLDAAIDEAHRAVGEQLVVRSTSGKRRPRVRPEQCKKEYYLSLRERVSVRGTGSSSMTSCLTTQKGG